MTFVSREDKSRYGSSADRTNSFDDSLEVEMITPILEKNYPGCVVIDKPYGPYGIDVVVRHGDVDVLWVELERSMGWTGRFRYNSISFLERKFHFVEEARDAGARFAMIWFERDHNSWATVSGEVIESFDPFLKTLRSGRQDMVRHIDTSQVNFHRTS